MSSVANVRRSVAVMRAGSSPRYSAQSSSRPRRPRISIALAKCLSCRLPDRISSPMTRMPIAMVSGTTVSDTAAGHSFTAGLSV